MLTDFQFAVDVTAPIFFIVLLGILLKRLGWLTDEFARVGSELVFKIALPCLLFVNLVKVNFRDVFPLSLILYAVAANIVLFLLLDHGVARLIRQRADRGAFVQGAYRANMGIVGLACCINAFGNEALATASIYLAVLTILFNVQAVLTLKHHQRSAGNALSVASTLLEIAKNPLIIAIVAAILISLLRLDVPKIALDTGNYIARMTLPLALLCAGASIRMQELHGSPPLYYATLAKLLLLPGVLTLGAALAGFRGMELGVLYLMSAAPTAAASYPMVRALGGNHHLAAAIIAATSLGSIFSTTLGLFSLRYFALL